MNAEWKPIDENTPTDEWHIRGLWVRCQLPYGEVGWEWQFHLGYVNDAGIFVDTEDEDTGLAPDGYTHWTPCNVPPYFAKPPRPEDTQP